MISYDGNFAILIFLLFCHSHLQPAGVRSEVETNSAMANEVINQFPCTNQGCEATFNELDDLFKHMAGGVCLITKQLTMYQLIRKGKMQVIVLLVSNSKLSIYCLYL